MACHGHESTVLQHSNVHSIMPVVSICRVNVLLLPFTIFGKGIDFSLSMFSGRVLLLSALLSIAMVFSGKRHAGEIAGVALELLDGIKVFQIPKMPEEKFRLRIGLHTGEAISCSTFCTQCSYKYTGS